jgi:Tfp pilus assembly protein FimT
VVVIIAIIGAIAIPRMSRGAQGADDAALIEASNLEVAKDFARIIDVPRDRAAMMVRFGKAAICGQP